MEKMKIRKILELSQENLAEGIGMSRSSIIKYENGEGGRKMEKLVLMYYIEKVIDFEGYLNKKSISKSLGTVIIKTDDVSWSRILNEPSEKDKKEYEKIVKNILIKMVSYSLGLEYGIDEIDKLRRYIMLEL
jgi:transcriptional regulator with XRE-family HTH domain